MKTLQNNFTTLEHSKRLLELGVPADSADCYYLDLGLNEYSDKPYWGFNADEFPCWSVGRLIEIYCTCRECTWEYITNNPPIEDMLCDIELYVGEMDFSKLEE